MTSYCTDVPSTSTSTSNSNSNRNCKYRLTSTIPTRLTNLVLPIADDNQEDDATTESNGSDSLSNNRKSNRPFFGDNYHDDCDYDNDCDDDDDVDMRDDSMNSVVNDIYNIP